ncbi:conserved protein of unknown function [Burkholderia multivorans]
MVTSGHPTRSRRPRGNRGLSRARLFASVTIAALGLALMSGCSTTTTFGTVPPVERLSSLKAGISTQGEVLATLGEPRGRGAVRWAATTPNQPVLFYEYAQSEGKKVRLKILLVFLDHDIYSGYMWFSSGQLLQDKP